MSITLEDSRELIFPPGSFGSWKRSSCSKAECAPNAGSITAAAAGSSDGHTCSIDHGHETTGGVMNLNNSTTQIACCTAGRLRKSRQATTASRNQDHDCKGVLRKPPEDRGHRGPRFPRFASRSSIICRNLAMSLGENWCRSANASTSGSASPSHSSPARSFIRDRITSSRETRARKTKAKRLLSLSTYPFRSRRCNSVITVDLVHSWPCSWKPPENLANRERTVLPEHLEHLQLGITRRGSTFIRHRLRPPHPVRLHHVNNSNLSTWCRQVKSD